MTTVIPVRFRSGSKTYYFDPQNTLVRTGDHVIVETSQGPEYAVCAQGNHEVDDSQVVQPLRPLIRVATENDRRTAHLTLTETGTAAAAEARVAQEAYFARIHGGIPGEDMEVFRSVTQRIWENIRNL